jgi:hypothetical protein
MRKETESIQPSEKNKEKTKGLEALLRDLDERGTELTEKKRKGWINEEEYQKEHGKLEEERLEILTRPNSGGG